MRMAARKAVAERGHRFHYPIQLAGGFRSRDAPEDICNPAEARAPPMLYRGTLGDAYSSQVLDLQRGGGYDEVGFGTPPHFVRPSLPATISAASRSGWSARCAYRLVVAGFECPSSRPMISKLRPSPTSMLA